MSTELHIKDPIQLPKTFDLDYLVEIDSEEDLYNEVSHQFNEITRDFYARANLEMMNHLNLKPSTNVLDLACGTGYIALEIAKKVPQGKVVGVDLSTLMLSRARVDAEDQKITNAVFLEQDIRAYLPTVKPGEFKVGVSCFALSYLGCSFLLDSFRQVLGENGQVGITTSSMNSLTEWMPLFFDFLQEHGTQASAFEINEIPDLPVNAEDMKIRMENAGFKNPKVIAQKIPLVFRDGEEAASFLISAGWLSNYFFRMKDKKKRREILEWGLNKVNEFHRNDPHISTSIEFLVAWNEPASL